MSSAIKRRRAAPTRVFALQAQYDGIDARKAGAALADCRMPPSGLGSRSGGSTGGFEDGGARGPRLEDTRAINHPPSPLRANGGWGVEARPFFSARRIFVVNLKREGAQRRSGTAGRTGRRRGA